MPHKLFFLIMQFWGRDSVVGVATRFGLDGPVIESQWGARLSASTQTGLGAHATSCRRVASLFPGGKAAGI
jgi:hypothetical protein